MKAILFITLALIFGLVTSCETKYDSVRPDNVLYLRSKGADMPVYVRGNLSSQVIILHLHGGPGGGAIVTEDWYKELSGQYAVALWEQRAAGSSSGNVDKSTLTYEQFAEDCGNVIRLLKMKYPQAKIFLMGRSFGVELGWQFLTTQNGQDQVAGWIAVNGTHSGFSYHYHQREWLLKAAKAQNNQPIYDWCQANPVTPTTLSAYDDAQAYRYMVKLGGDQSGGITPGFIVQKTFFSPVTMPGSVLNVLQFFRNKDVTRQFKAFDRSAYLPQIKLPVALFWGKMDGNVPIEIGRETDSLLTNCPKRFITFDKSWHSPQETENGRFTSEVIDFIKTYK